MAKVRESGEGRKVRKVGKMESLLVRKTEERLRDGKNVSPKDKERQEVRKTESPLNQLQLT
jgi:hypothetical protein